MTRLPVMPRIERSSETEGSNARKLSPGRNRPFDLHQWGNPAAAKRARHGTGSVSGLASPPHDDI
ncbi:MAG TPA: hypothetical protein VMA86_06835, partial [Acetobacteraceae bacterium]|nr:hypothetical protein [Acetobacteraceae bacterium]